MILLLMALVLNHIVTPTQWSPSNLDWDKAANQIQRLSPNTFIELPAAIIRDLTQRRCTIPQIDGSLEPHNVIKGSFIRKGNIDWAVLCSRDGESSIVVFNGQTNELVAQLATSADKDWLQTIGEKKIGFSRRILPVDRAYILRHYQAYGGPKPPPIDHQGINDAFVEKGSVVRYYNKGGWLTLTGAD